MNSLRVRKTAHGLVRWGILAGVLAYVSWEFYAHAAVSKVHPSVHALCPLGGLESLLRYVAGDGATLGKIFSGTMGLFFVSLGTALLFKRAFCGNVCPLGTLQELAGNLGRKVLGPRRFLVPRRLDKVLRWAKYLALALAVVMAWATGTLWIQAVDPWPAYSHLFSPSELFPAYAAGLVLLAASLVASFFYERAFCKYLCPMGALTAVAGLASPFKARRDEAACVSCGLCDQACPVNLEVSKAAAVADAECLSCGKCAAVCPAPKALDLGFSKRPRLSPAAAVALGAGAFFLGVLALQLLGFDRFSGRQEPTLRELARSQGQTVAEFKEAYGLPSGLYGGTRASGLEKALPLSKFAEMNGTDAAALKATLGLDPALDEDVSWGEAYGSVKLGRIAELNGMSLEDFKKTFSLKASAGADTPWREVEKAVIRASERLAAEAAAAEGEGGGSCSGD